MGPQDQRHPDAAQRHFVRADAVFLAVAVLGSAALQFSFPQLIGSDGFFHLRMAERVLTGEMPWMPGSIFDEGWVDHQLLFHAAMAPFAWLLEGVVAAKLAAATFAAVAAFALWRFLRAERCPHPALFALLPFGLSWLFWLRMEMPRTQSLSLALLVASIAALSKGRHRTLFVLAWIYAWTYHVALVLLPVSLLYAIVIAQLPGGSWRRFRWQGPAAAGAGLLAGLLIHPHSPRTLRFLWQHVVQKVSNHEELPVGLEWQDGGLSPLLGLTDFAFLQAGGGLLALVLAAAVLLRLGKRCSGTAVFMAVLAAGATLGVCAGTKFVEYSVPLSVLSLALALRDLDPWPGPSSSRREIACAAGLAILLLSSGFLVAEKTRATEPHPDELSAAAEWIQENVPPGERVFHFHWNDFPELVFHAPEYRYVVGLDPHFLYLADPDRWAMYEALGGAWPGQAADYPPLRSEAISQAFEAHWAVLRLPHPGAREALGGDPGLVSVFDDGEHAVVYKVQAAP